ncbi:hypothetical protein NQ314_009756 [Rhamnusium bicolor]|uniref:adenine phosphoribosyltransferase n=1 Tax=Rhamnusium bicolor TaxID=1586634 RepID=A0AAV8XYQ0_9CUCU|nr:hypothetical protein NQ314_009756 [Rhamnusium bicolor]
MSNIKDKIKIIESHVKSYPDFPKKGILFWDVFSVLQNPEIFGLLKEVLVQTVKEIQPPVDCVVALDARGFLFGPLISLELKVPFVPIRKKGGSCRGKSDRIRIPWNMGR